MAQIDDLVKRVANPELRSDIQTALKKLRKGREFGLVFEEHLPEVLALPELRLEAGQLAQLNDRTKTLCQVLSLDGSSAEIRLLNALSCETETTSVDELTPVARFGDPIYPTLEHLGSVERANTNKPHHLVIDSENYHALQLLVHLYRGKVDCIYIDPPYNSGATDWKYNNKYIDNNDSYRHSKWLSMMEKRLGLAGELLNNTGTLIIAIDENELHHLWLLVEQMFPGSHLQMVTLVTNRSGVETSRFRRIEEHLLYCFMPPSKTSTLVGTNLSEGISKDKSKKFKYWESFIRTGKGWTPSARPNLVYPIGVDPNTMRIVGTGPSLRDRLESQSLGEQYTDRQSLDDWTPSPSETVNGARAIWPVHSNQKLGIWRLKADTLMDLSNQGYIQITEHEGSYNLKYLLKGTIESIESGGISVVGTNPEDGSVMLPEQDRQYRIKTVWNRSEHLTEVGSNMLTNMLGPNSFDYPKPLYAVYDALLPVVADNPTALILDFFAGSGTTLHATLLHNEQDGGTRQCILVTNNEIGPDNEKRLAKQGITPHSDEWEGFGIFESVTRPRVEAAITGRRADGASLPGEYSHTEGKPLAEGFEENADFLRLRYLDPDRIIAAKDFDALHPLLWAAARCAGPCPTSSLGAPVSEHEPGYLLPGDGLIPEGNRYAVLLRESRFSSFSAELASRSELTHVWLQARSENSYSEMKSELPRQLSKSWLFQDYYRHFDVDVRSARR